METLAYVVEVARHRDAKALIDAYAEVFQKDLLSQSIAFQTTMDGRRQIRRYVPELNAEGVQDLPPEGLQHYAFKMATGSGKTWVIAMAIVWSHFHKQRAKLPTAFAKLYPLVRTYVAVVAEVEVKRSTGEIGCTRFYISHDCGQIINPDGLKNQLEGNVIQTVSRTLMEELKFDRSMVTSLDWETYPILKFPDVPEIVMDLIDRPAERPWGAGEPAAAVVPSAISNAVFDAIGVRLRSVPFTPDKVKAALA